MSMQELRVVADQEVARKMQKLPILHQVDGLTYGFSDRSFGNMDPRFGPIESVINSRGRFAQTLGINLSDMVVMEPVHKANITVVGKYQKGLGAFDLDSAVGATDALITTEKGVALVLNPADCTPIIITNKKGDFAAMVHAGRDGTNLDISGKTIQELVNLGYDPREFLVGIGPVVCCYAQRFIRTEDPNRWLEFMWLPADSPDEIVVKEIGLEGSRKSEIRSSNPNGEIFVDLIGINTSQLVEKGVPRENIQAMHYCTNCNAKERRTFSHITTANANDETTFPEGRFMAVVQLKEN